MDFRTNAQPAPRPTVAPAPSNGTHKESKRKRDFGGGKWLRILSAVVIIGMAILLAFVAIAFTRSSNNEFKLVNTSKYQAVFLNNGQVYFGKITNLNNSYVKLGDIFYLTQNSSGAQKNATSNGNYTLVKLGCQQIHDPYDQMVINRSQVTFWENLQDSGKVVTSIKKFQQQNPNGPDCSQVSTQTQATSNAGTQGAQASSSGVKQ